MENRIRYYTLNESGDPVPLTDGSWPELTNEQRRVGADTVDGQDVSTVFLVLDHRHGPGSPLLYETMIFGGKWDEYCWRYSTKAEAQAGHDAVVAALREGRDPDAAVTQ